MGISQEKEGSCWSSLGNLILTELVSDPGVLKPSVLYLRHEALKIGEWGLEDLTEVSPK